MTDAPKQPGRNAFIFVFIIAVLDMLAVGMLVPILPGLIVEMDGGPVGEAAPIVGLMGAAWSAMQFVFMPIFGALSDRVGRRPVILISSLGLGLAYVIAALAPSLAWLFVARLLSGMCAANLSTANAYIADVTPPERRAGVYGYMGAAFGAGFILGPALGGALGEINSRLPFWAAAGLSFVVVIYGLFVLPESLPKANRSSFSWAKANPLAAFAFLGERKGLQGLAAARFLENLAHVVFPSVFVLWAGFQFGWSEGRIGLALAAAGVLSVLVQAGLVRTIVARLGERRTLLFGMIMGVCGFTLYGSATGLGVFAAGLVVQALWGVSAPAAQAILSTQVLPYEQGRLQGALSSLMGLAGMIGPLIFTGAFAAAVRADATGPTLAAGAPFFLAAAMVAMALAIALAALKSMAVAPLVRTPENANGG